MLMLSSITDIEALVREEDHHAYFRVTYNKKHQVTSSGLSDGTLCIMAHTLLSYLQTPPHLLIVEELENGIHPRSIEAVLDGLSSISHSQVLISSHSPVVIANSRLEHILTTRLERNGAVSVVAGIRHPRLINWQGELDLGTLFAAGVLG
jgi:predicted ATPase